MKRRQDDFGGMGAGAMGGYGMPRPDYYGGMGAYDDGAGKRMRGGGGRFNDMDGGGRMGKQIPPDQHRREVRLLFNGRFAGAVIGRGGDNIKRLRSQFDVNVSVPASETPERAIQIVSQKDDFSQVLEAVRDAIPMICDEKSGEDAEEKEYDCRVLIHQSHAGAVIGKGGAKIRDLREQCKTQIKVFQACAPQSTERVVLISGSIDQIMRTLEQMQTLIRDSDIVGPNRPYDTVNHVPEMVRDYGGIPGPGGMQGGMGMGMGMGGGGRGGGMMGAPRGGAFGGGGMGGPPMARDMGGYGGYGPPMGHDPMAAMGGAPPAYAAAPRDPYMPPAAAAAPAGPVTVSQVTIPDALAGTVIGRGGERINDIRRESGAKVIVEPLRPGETERIISITGTQAQIQSAQYLLQQCVRSSEAGRRYIDGQQHGGAPPPARAQY